MILNCYSSIMCIMFRSGYFPCVPPTDFKCYVCRRDGDVQSRLLGCHKNMLFLRHGSICHYKGVIGVGGSTCSRLICGKLRFVA